MNSTRHATSRMQQRGISKLVIDLLIEFGCSVPAGDGTSKLFFDKPARRKIKAYAGPLADVLDKHLNVYAVVGADTQVITVGHRYDRMHRH